MYVLREGVHPRLRLGRRGWLLWRAQQQTVCGRPLAGAAVRDSVQRTMSGLPMCVEGFVSLCLALSGSVTLCAGQGLEAGEEGGFRVC